MSLTLLAHAQEIIRNWKTTADANTSPHAAQLREDLAIVHAALEEETLQRMAIPDNVCQRFRFTHAVDVTNLRMGHGKKSMLLQNAVRDLTTSTAQSLISTAGSYGGFEAERSGHTIRMAYSMDAVQYHPSKHKLTTIQLLTADQMFALVDNLTHT